MGTERNWTEGPWVGFDTETTGVDVTGDRVVQAAVVRRADGLTDARTWLIDPGIEIPAGAAAVHGITTEHARRYGARPVDALEEIAAALAAAAGRGEPIVAFNASFDLCMLDADLRRHGLVTLTDRLGGEVRALIDPLVLDRELVRFRRGKRRLGDLLTAYGVLAPEALHAADVDVVATLDLLAAMVAQHPVLATMDLAALRDWQVGAHHRWAEDFNRWRAGKGLTGPGAETVWPARLPG